MASPIYKAIDLVCMLNPKLATAQLASKFRPKRRIQIQDALLPEYAEHLYDCLETKVPWGVAYVETDGKPVILTSEKVTDLTREDWSNLHKKVQLSAPDRFQFLYNSYMMINAYKGNRDPGLILHRVVEYLNTDLFLAFVRLVTGAKDIVKADAQATRYIPGSFLKKHNDLNEQGNRRIAYVLNLTRDWQADWGGMLQFLDETGHVEETHFPTFNSLTLFEVPMWHNVSYVVPYAKNARYAITGWAMSH